MPGAVEIEEVLDQIRKEFEVQLKGPGVQWNKTGMLLQLEKAIAKALAQFVEAY